MAFTMLQKIPNYINQIRSDLCIDLLVLPRPAGRGNEGEGINYIFSSTPWCVDSFSHSKDLPY